jgi:hypothetical protein
VMAKKQWPRSRRRDSSGSIPDLYDAISRDAGLRQVGAMQRFAGHRFHGVAPDLLNPHD